MKKLLIFALAFCVPLAACTDTAKEETSAVSETSALTEVFEETESESVSGEPDETGTEYSKLMNEYHILQYANMFDTTIDDGLFIGSAAQ